MQSREIKQYNDAKKASESSNRSDVGKKYTTHEDRCWNFKRFLTPLTLGTMTMAARMGGAQSHALQSLSDSSTGLTPAFPDQRAEIIGKSPTELHVPTQQPEAYHGPTVEQIWPHAFDKYVREIEEASKNSLQGEAQEIYDGETSSEQREGKEGKGKEPLSSNEKKIASLPARKEVVKANRKVLERVWSTVLRRELAADTTSVVFVRGLNGGQGVPNGSGLGNDCNNYYWKEARQFLSSHGITDLRTIGIYNGDSNCDAYLHAKNKPYESNCANYHANAKADGTNNESLYHLSCLFAQYLHDTFGQSNKDVVLVGHCMGGIIIREAMDQMQYNAGKSPFPKTIGHVTNAITLNTPHSGIIPLDTWPGIKDQICGGCNQAQELEKSGALMSNLINYGQNPQISGGFTTWTVFGSECDDTLYKAGIAGTGVASAIDMHASHAVMYSQDGRTADSTCYNHGGIIHAWEPKKLDAHLYHCDTTDPEKSPCGTDYKDQNGQAVGHWQYTEKGPHGLLAMYDEMVGQSL